MSLLCRCPEGS